jgi:adenine phosphoribosyltransferase
MDLKKHIRDIPDFPSPGILFKDITTLLGDPEVFSETIEQLHHAVGAMEIDAIAGVESRGFIFGTPLAMKLGVGFIPIRKPGKLPAETIQEEYTLEYGTNTVEMHTDAVSDGMRVLVVDDLLATGGTAEATCKLIERGGGTVVATLFIIELEFLNGREKLQNHDVISLISY